MPRRDGLPHTSRAERAACTSSARPGTAGKPLRFSNAQNSDDNSACPAQPRCLHGVRSPLSLFSALSTRSPVPQMRTVKITLLTKPGKVQGGKKHIVLVRPRVFLGKPLSEGFLLLIVVANSITCISAVVCPLYLGVPGWGTTRMLFVCEPNV